VAWRSGGVYLCVPSIGSKPVAIDARILKGFSYAYQQWYSIPACDLIINPILSINLAAGTRAGDMESDFSAACAALSAAKGLRISNEHVCMHVRACVCAAL
jgi:hypothetical protein